MALRGKPAVKPAGLRRIFESLVRLLTETDTTLAEFASSTVCVCVGALLALPTVALTPSVPLFSLMAYCLPEWAWATLFVTVGLAQALGNLFRIRWARRASAFILFTLFGFLGVLGGMAHPVSVLGTVFGVHSIVQGIVYLRLGVRGA